MAVSDPIKVISSRRDLDNILSAAGSAKLTVIDFHATWCGPCKLIAPCFKSMAEKYHTQANFLKCDVDEAQDVAQHYGIRSMPTFLFIKGKDEAERMVGANWKELEKKVEFHVSGAPSPAGAFTGKGQTLGGKTVTPGPSTGALNLTPQAKVVIGLVLAYAVLWYFS